MQSNCSAALLSGSDRGKGLFRPLVICDVKTILSAYKKKKKCCFFTLLAGDAVPNSSTNTISSKSKLTSEWAGTVRPRWRWPAGPFLSFGSQRGLFCPSNLKRSQTLLYRHLLCLHRGRHTAQPLLVYLLGI